MRSAKALLNSMAALLNNVSAMNEYTLNTALETRIADSSDKINSGLMG